MKHRLWPSPYQGCRLSQYIFRVVRETDIFWFRRLTPGHLPAPENQGYIRKQAPPGLFKTDCTYLQRIRSLSDKAIQQLPFTNEDSSDPERLWDNLEGYEKNTGGKVLAIPHNGNLSNGMMFAETTVSGKA